MIYRLSLLSLFAFFIGCANSTSTTAEADAAPKEKIAEKVDANTFSEKLKTLKEVQLVDVRTPEEFGAGAIPNAVNINFYGENFDAQITGLDKQKPIMVYCQAGSPGGRSGQTLEKLKEKGFEEIYELAGGYAGWSAK